jgi:hypothetical protein
MADEESVAHVRQEGDRRMGQMIARQGAAGLPLSLPALPWHVQSACRLSKDCVLGDGLTGFLLDQSQERSSEGAVGWMVG